MPMIDDNNDHDEIKAVAMTITMVRMIIKMMMIERNIDERKNRKMTMKMTKTQRRIKNSDGERRIKEVVTGMLRKDDDVVKATVIATTTTKMIMIKSIDGDEAKKTTTMTPKIKRAVDDGNPNGIAMTIATSLPPMIKTIADVVKATATTTPKTTENTRTTKRTADNDEKV